MVAQNYAEQKRTIGEWDVTLISYQLGEVFHAKVESVAVGAAISRATGATLEEAVSTAMSKAAERLGRTARREI